MVKGADLRAIASDVEQAAREIYYAFTFLELDHPARVNLTVALRTLGVFRPKDVGLSEITKYYKETN